MSEHLAKQMADYALRVRNDHLESDILRALGLADVAREESDALRAINAKLLAALKRAEIVLSDPNSETTEAIWDAVVIEVRAAIAKAKSA